MVTHKTFISKITILTLLLMSASAAGAAPTVGQPCPDSRKSGSTAATLSATLTRLRESVRPYYLSAVTKLLRIDRQSGIEIINISVVDEDGAEALKLDFRDTSGGIGDVEIEVIRNGSPAEFVMGLPTNRNGDYSAMIRIDSKNSITGLEFMRTSL